jgi:hypothetical protein
MKKTLITLLLVGLTSLGFGQALKPYILASTATDMAVAKEQAKANLEEAGFTIAGEYMPVEDNSRWIIIVSHSELDKAVKSVGGLTGFASTLRVGITTETAGVNISYTNPTYWGNAYFRDDFPKVEVNYKAVSEAFKTALNSIGTKKDSPFGSEEGVELEDLRNYQYMFSMPDFDDTKEFGDFDNYEAVIVQIEKSMKWGKPGVTLVYRHDIPGTKLSLFGFALSGITGETNFMPKIDITSPKHTAFLPYEFLVMDNEVHMLHGRFRIALSFPDLTMGTFTKIMSTPGNIEDLLKQIVEN